MRVTQQFVAVSKFVTISLDPSLVVVTMGIIWRPIHSTAMVYWYKKLASVPLILDLVQLPTPTFSLVKTFNITCHNSLASELFRLQIIYFPVS